MQNYKTLDTSRIAQELQIRKAQIEQVVQLLDEGNTIPFITRYRKERTGGLDEEMIRQIQLWVNLQRQLADRKQTILKSIETQGKLTDELRDAILGADTNKRLEDLYLPFKPKKRTLATTARERGLEPLALAIWNRDAAAADLGEILPTMVDPEKELHTVDDVKAGVKHILAELISETADVRAAARFALWDTGAIRAQKNEKLPPGKGLLYKDYFDFVEPLRRIPAHRILAINRGEREGALKVKLEWNEEKVTNDALRALADFCLRQAQSGQFPTPSSTAIEKTETSSASPTPEQPTSATSEVPTPSIPESGTFDISFTGGPAPTADNSVAQPIGQEPSAPLAEAPAAASTPVAFEIASHGDPLTPASEYRTPHAEFIKEILNDALQRLILPSLEREIRRELSEEAQMHASKVFARNLRGLLLQRPVRNVRVLAIDPAFRTGCKLAALDEYGNLLEHAIVYPFPIFKKSKKKEKKKSQQGADSSSTPQVDNPTAESSAATPTGNESATSPADADQADGSQGPTSSPPAESVEPQESSAASAEPQAAVEENPTPAAEPTSETIVATEEASAPTQEATTAPTPMPGDESAPAVEPAAEKDAEQQAKEEAQAARQKAKDTIVELVRKHALHVAAIGNGTACRETEEFISEIIAESLPEFKYTMVNEAGASVYSASAVGREEFPDADATLRSAVSIGRRLQDPLAELVKIDPPNLGVGLYQHDVNPKQLKESLDAVVESCVNTVGVDVNTASVPLLRYVAGLNQLLARSIVEYRTTHGAFRNRQQFMEVTGFGPSRFTQAAGFLKIHGGDHPFDGTWIHPESYEVAERLLEQAGFGLDVLQNPDRQPEFHAKLRSLSPAELAAQLKVGEPTIRDIIDSLLKPGRDPREDLPLPIFRKGVLKLEDLTPEMELQGTVLNVVDFGAFVDIGLKDSGLVHISQMANRFIKSPYEIVSVGDIVTVWVLNVDTERRHVSLAMIKPGTDRKPRERRRERPAAERPEQPRRPDGREAPRRDHPGPRRREPQQAARSTHPGGRHEDRARSRPAGRSEDQSRKLAPRKPRRDQPRPKLTKEALEGKEPLRTFGELSALFAAKKDHGKPKPQTPTVEQAPAAEQIGGGQLSDPETITNTEIPLDQSATHQQNDSQPSAEPERTSETPTAEQTQSHFEQVAEQNGSAQSAEKSDDIPASSQ